MAVKGGEEVTRLQLHARGGTVGIHCLDNNARKSSHCCGDAQQLACLARLQRTVGGCGLASADYEPLQAKLGQFGDAVEARAKIVSGVARANAPAVHRLMLLLKLAVGDSAPLGPAATRARHEALRLAKQPDTRAELAAAPEQMQTMRDLIQRAALAA